MNVLRLSVALVAAASAELAATALTATAAWLICRAAQQPELPAVALAIVAVRALALGRGVLRYGERLLGHDATLAAMAGLRARVYRALVPLAPAGLPAFRSGALLNRLVSDVEAGQDLLLRCLFPAVVAGVAGATAVAVTAALLPQAALVLAFGLLLAAVLIPLTARDAAPPPADELAAQIVDLTRGADDLAVFGAAPAAIDRARRSAAALARAERRRSRTVGTATTLVLLLQGLTTIAVTWVAVHAPGLPPVHLAVLAVLALTAFEALVPLPEAARRLVEVRAAARRLTTVMTTEPPVTEPSEAPPLPARPVIELRNVTARRTLALPDLRLEPGRRVAVVGPSGSGKSTLTAVLMRFLEYEGSVTVGGHELRALPGEAVRRLVTGMTQHDHLFDTTIRANIALPRPDATPDELRAVAARARLLDWIESLPDGWDTRVGPDGSRVSGGQRRRLLLARALLADPAVLILDEPTEGLDPDTADAVLTDLLDATRDRAVLLITHHPGALPAVDEVVDLTRGCPTPWRRVGARDRSPALG